MVRDERCVCTYMNQWWLSSKEDGWEWEQMGYGLEQIAKEDQGQEVEQVDGVFVPTRLAPVQNL